LLREASPGTPLIFELRHDKLQKMKEFLEDFFIPFDAIWMLYDKKGVPMRNNSGGLLEWMRFPTLYHLGCSFFSLSVVQ
jgi:hypothetical protein